MDSFFCVFFFSFLLCWAWWIGPNETTGPLHLLPLTHLVNETASFRPNKFLSLLVCSLCLFCTGPSASPLIFSLLSSTGPSPPASSSSLPFSTFSSLCHLPPQRELVASCHRPPASSLISFLSLFSFTELSLSQSLLFPSSLAAPRKSPNLPNSPLTPNPNFLYRTILFF